MKYGRVAIFVLAFIALGTIFLQLKTPTVAAEADSSPFAKNFSLVDKDGNIAKPDDYRDKYETLGTYFVLDPAGSQMHMTYASPGRQSISGRMESSLTEQCLLKRSSEPSTHR